MFVVYALIAGGVGVWLHIILPKISEKNWPSFVYGLAANARIGASLAAAYVLVNPREFSGVGDLGAGIAIFTLLVGAARAGFAWLAGKAGFGGADKNHLRGAVLQDEQAVARGLRGQPSRFSVGQVPVPIELETRGFLLAGTTGTGKSQTLTHALDALRADGQRAVVADASGIYCSRFYDERRDVIINPFDERSPAWSPLAEIESIADVPALAKSLVPDGEGATAAEWNGYAQTFTEAVLEYCFLGGATNRELLYYLVSAGGEELREICSGTPAEALLAEENVKMFSNIRGIAASNAKFLRYLDPSAGAANGFSIRKHITEERDGWIFLSYQQQHRDALKSMIACAVDISARAVLSLPPSPDRRVVFGLDELPLLGKVQSIIDLATNGRKHGSVIFAGLQTISQARETYGPNTSQTLLACLGSWLVLRVSDPETAEYMSKYLGEEEKTRKVKSGGKSSQSMQWGGSKSDNWQQQVVQGRVMLPSELQSLPDLQGIFNLAGPTPAARVKLQVAGEHTTAEAFIAAPPRERAKRPAKEQEQGGVASADMPDLL